MDLGRTTVPATWFFIDERRQADGWSYRVVASDGDRHGAIGPVWSRHRVHAPAPRRMPACDVRDLATNLATSMDETWFRPLVELAVWKATILEPTDSLGEVEAYRSVLDPRIALPDELEVLLKVSAQTDVEGIEETRPVAYDALNGFASWSDVEQLAVQRPHLRWIEDPMPPEKWPAQPCCEVPIVAGENLCDPGAVAVLCERAANLSFAANLELSRLGPVGFIDSVAVATAAGKRAIAHGHLPLETALIVSMCCTPVMVELNLAHLQQRCGPRAARVLLDRGSTPFGPEAFTSERVRP